MSVVITGPRMHGSEIFTLCSGLVLAHSYADSVALQEMSVGPPDVAVAETRFDHRLGAEQPRHLDRGDRGHVVLHHIDEIALLADLHRSRRHHNGILSSQRYYH